MSKVKSSAATGGESLADQVRYLTTQRDELRIELNQYKNALRQASESYQEESRKNYALANELEGMHSQNNDLRVALDQADHERDDWEESSGLYAKRLVEVMVERDRLAASALRSSEAELAAKDRALRLALRYVVDDDWEPGNIERDVEVPIRAALSASPPEQPTTCPNACIEAEGGERYIASKPSGRVPCSDPWHGEEPTYERCPNECKDGRFPRMGPCGYAPGRGTHHHNPRKEK